MTVAIPLTASAQTPEPVIESVPAADRLVVANTNPTGDENGTDKSTSVQTDAPAKPAIPATVEVEIQSRLNELRRELLDDRADNVYWWLVAITIVLGFLAIVSVVIGYMGFGRFREIETEAKSSVKILTDYTEVGGRHVKEIEKNKDKSDEIVRGMNAQTAADDSEKASQAIANVRENPRASLVDRAIAHAISLQQEGKRDDAIEKWQAIAHVAEGTDNDLAAAAWFSVGYLLQNENPEDATLAYNRAICLKPDLAEAYTNRGNVKVELGRHVEAIADYDEAICLKPDDDKAYSNRGVAKMELGRHDDAMADHDEAIRLKPDYAGAYNNRGVLKVKLGLKNEARKDFKTALELARKTNNAKIVTQAKQSLRDLDSDVSS